MKFHEKRRQQFLSEVGYEPTLKAIDLGIEELEENFRDNAAYPASQMRLSASITRDKFSKLLLHYTAGEPIDPLRAELEEVIAAYERYGEYLWQYTGDRNDFVFEFSSIDEYCQLMQLIGLCFLLHRRDLLPRLAALQDGREGENGGADNLYEEFMSHGLGAETRYESDWIFAAKPYQALSDALYSETNDEALKHLNLFLKHWYKDLAGTGWHDSHIADEDGNQGGYYGYWSFEAGAAVILLGIEDDSSLHQYLYYPKDLVAWARANKHLEQELPVSTAGLRVPGGEACPRTGWWHTPAAKDSRRYFNQGDTLPSIEGSSYGDTYWLWDANQDSPKL